MTFEELNEEYARREGGDPVRVAALYEEVRRVSAAPPGDYAEFGVHIGLTLKVIFWAMERGQKLYGFDTFLGFDESDIAVEREFNPGTVSVVGNFSPTRAGEVRGNIGGDQAERLVLIEGRFPQTFETFKDKVWRFVHVDMDLYWPTHAAASLLWPRIVPGGAMMFHDYGCTSFPGVKRVVDELQEEVGAEITVLGDKHGTALLRKLA